MVGVGSASFVVHLVVAFFWFWREAPPVADVSLERTRATVILEPKLPDTCPAECPAPSLAFCAGPLLDLLDAYVDVAVETGRGLRGWLPAVCFGVAGLVIGRLTAPSGLAPLRRPHGSGRVREADRAGRSHD